VHTNQIQIPAPGRRRGRYSDAFKSQVIAAARQSGVSTAAVALAHGLNANLLRRWICESELPPSTALLSNTATTPVLSPFVALQIAPCKENSDGGIHIEIQRAGTTVRIQWPVSATNECAAWMREVLK
jgi:transposase-like protein